MTRLNVRTLALAGVIVFSLALTLALSGCGGKEVKDPQLGLEPGASQGSTAPDGSGTAASGTTNPKTPADPGSSAGGETSGGQAGGTSGGGTTDGTGSGGASTKPSTAAKTIRIKWWNDTQGKAPKNPTVEFGGKSVKPKAGKSDTLAIGPCAVGKDLKLTIYPDGPSGTKAVATFRVTASMISDSEQDAIHIEVRDDRIRVLGNPIPNFEQSFARR